MFGIGWAELVVLGLCGFTVVGGAVIAVVITLVSSRKSGDTGPSELARLRAEVERLRDEVERLQKERAEPRPAQSPGNTGIQ